MKFFASSILAFLCLLISSSLFVETTLGDDDLVRLFKTTQSKVAKIYGAGKIGGLENYQSGFFVSDQGHILTAWSTVLDSDLINVLTYDGKRWEATLVGMDPQTELALLKIDGEGFPFFALPSPADVEVGDRVFGVSNLFNIATGNEDQSIQRGVVMAKSVLTAHRGRMQTPYTGEILVIDVITNNPGAMGGALINLRGDFVGALGKELRDDATGNWLNFALPAKVVADCVKNILAGETALVASTKELKPAANPHQAGDLGFAFVPNVLAKTPAYINQVRSNSLAARAGLQANDLILNINGRRVESRKSAELLLSTIDRADVVRLLVQRGNELIAIDLNP